MNDDASAWRTHERSKMQREGNQALRIGSRTLPRFLARFRDARGNLEALLRKYELPADAAQQPELQVTLETLRAIPDEIAEAMHAPFLGLELGQQLAPTTLGLIELATRTSPNLSEALTRLCKYSALLNDVESFALAVEGQEAALTHQISGTRRALGRHGNELLMAYLVRLVRESLQRRWNPSEVCFAQTGPDDRHQLEAFFGTTHLMFEMGHNELRFPAADLALPLASADAKLLAMFDDAAEKHLGSGAGDPLLAKLQSSIKDELKNGRPTLQVLADKLNMSARTLQRRLDAHHTTFNELVEATRIGLAKEYVLNPRVALKEVAFWVGYADLPTFIRAFKRATGMTPNEFRQSRSS